MYPVTKILESVNEETGDEILTRQKLGKYEEQQEMPVYDWFYSEICDKMISCAKEMTKR